MQQLKSLFKAWQRWVHPQLMTFIATVGGLWLGICLLLILLLAHLSDEVLEQEAFWFDETILLSLHQWANPTLDHIMLGITQLGSPAIVVPLACITISWLCWRHQWRGAVVFFFTCLGAVGLSIGLKLLFGKARPQLWPPLIVETTYSFPSGHALGAMVLYGLLAYLVAQRYGNFKVLIYGTAAMLIGAIGLSRLYLGVHWPTDVLAGYGIGFLWLSLGIGLLRLTTHP
ncbi:phosphatase PAP2 family protein [Leptolyngbya iicbica]|uniref:Phosphatase PAP2 family protein n=2 Tax=Cyanophyceae TaxID=3028117 RepID=A0A4V2E2B4_9CYAN|nr:phosphatase PAP2 family protein [Leptolyngbya sp. LK]RZM77766.1 phosphatase PAP2 family protein [Leptolyngbya sp. LK]